MLLPNTNTGGTASLLSFRFTDFSIMAQDTAHVFNTNGNTQPICFQDCQLHSGTIYSTNATLHFTNCLLERVNATLWANDANAPQIRNNLFWNGSLDIKLTPSTSMIRNNLFDGTLLTDHGITGYVGTYNGYLLNSNHLTYTNAADVFLSGSPAYSISTLGNYYLPSGSPLINKGSTTADTLGLYDFTTQTSQLLETNSTVDIGYHYVGLDANGVPVTTSGDGTPDYLAGGSYNSFFNQGNWVSTSNCGDAVSDYIKFLQGRNPSICTTLSDTNGILALQVYTPLK